jgi:hypothetical protein
MWADCNKGKFHHLLPENEIITDEKKENIQGCVSRTTSRITESEFIHHLLKRRIEKINDIFDQFLHDFNKTLQS